MLFPIQRPSLIAPAVPHFKTALAYTLEDVEKHYGPLPVDPSLRDELSRLAVTSPGLKNKQMQSLLLLTPTLADRDLGDTIAH